MRSGHRAAPAVFAATDVTGVSWGHGFRLADPQGHLRTLEDFRGKVVMLFFGYTHCPDFCPPR
jgi:protein SCO1/2